MTSSSTSPAKAFSGRKAPKLLSAWPVFGLTLAVLLGGSEAQAGPAPPTGGKVAAGTASVGPAKNGTLTINQSSGKAIIAFVDAGYGRNDFTRAASTPLGTGLGFDYQLGRHLSATLDGALALKDEGLPRSGGFRLQSRVLSF